MERTIPGVDATRDEFLPYVGPAAALPLWSALARLPFDAARQTWLGLLACAWVGLLVSTLLLARVSWNAPLALSGAAMLGACAGPVVSDVALGQAALLAACAVSVTLLAIERRWTVATIAAAFVAAIQPNLAVALAPQLANRRNAILLVVAAAVFFAATLAFGNAPGGTFAYLHRLTLHGEGERFILIQYSIPAILAAFALPDATARAIGELSAVFVIVAVAYAAVRMRERSLTVTALAIALLPFALPFFHEHDFVIELIPALLLGASGDARARAFASLGAMCVLVDWFGVAQRPQTALMTAALAAAVAFAWAAYIRPARAVAFAYPLGACALVAAVAIPLALAHPAPVWPDMLGAFHAAPGADASAVWAAEQQRAGLGAREPAWGVLRAIPLLGCALLASAGLVAARAPATPLTASA